MPTSYSSATHRASPPCHPQGSNHLWLCKKAQLTLGPSKEPPKNTQITCKRCLRSSNRTTELKIRKKSERSRMRRSSCQMTKVMPIIGVSPIRSILWSRWAAIHKACPISPWQKPLRRVIRGKELAKLRAKRSRKIKIPLYWQWLRRPTHRN